MMVAMAVAQAWHLQLLQRDPSSVQSVTYHAARGMAGSECGLRAPGSPLSVLVFALLARCMRLQQVVITAWALVLEFLMVSELE